VIAMVFIGMFGIRVVVRVMAVCSMSIIVLFLFLSAVGLITTFALVHFAG
jgi:hypothetical protein